MEMRPCIHFVPMCIHTFLRLHLKWIAGERERGKGERKRDEEGERERGERKSQRGSLKCGRGTKKKDAAGLFNLLRHDKCSESIDLREALCHFRESEEEKNYKSQILALWSVPHCSPISV